MSAEGAIDDQTGSAQAREARLRGDWVSAASLYLAQVRAHPSDVGLAIDAAACALMAGDLAAAAKVLRPHRAQGMADPVAARLLHAQGLVLRRLGRPEEAASCFQACVGRRGAAPHLLHEARRQWSELLLNTLGDARASAGVYAEPCAASHPDGGLSILAALERLDPDARLTALVSGLYTGDLPEEDLVAGFRAFAAREIAAKAPSQARPGATRRARGRGARLRLGFVSGQFCASPVGFLTLGVVESLSRNADLVMFDRGSKPDWAHHRFRQASSAWFRCAEQPPATLASLWADAELDALFDLCGWMDLDVLRAFAAKPVARQFKWVGGQSLTTGLDCFAGFVTDARQVPEGSAHLYSEPLLLLSGSYITYTSAPYRDLSAAAARPPTPRPTPQGRWALVSNPVKIGAPTLELVRQLKPEVLVLIDHRWRHAHPRRLAEAWFGSHVGRIEFVSPATHPEYLEALQACDATVLDTRPYSMGLTAVELRLLGVPVHLPPPPALGSMRQFHALGHAATERFDDFDSQAAQLLEACT